MESDEKMEGTQAQPDDVIDLTDEVDPPQRKTHKPTRKFQFKSQEQPHPRSQPSQPQADFMFLTEEMRRQRALKQKELFEKSRRRMAAKRNVGIDIGGPSSHGPPLHFQQHRFGQQLPPRPQRRYTPPPFFREETPQNPFTIEVHELFFSFLSFLISPQRPSCSSLQLYHRNVAVQFRRLLPTKRAIADAFASTELLSEEMRWRQGWRNITNGWHSWCILTKSKKPAWRRTPRKRLDFSTKPF